MKKIKHFIISFINWVIRLGGIIEGLILFFVGIYLNSSNKGAYYLLLCVLGAYLIYRCSKLLYYVWKSKKIIIEDSYNSRTQVFEGPPGRGKTSLLCYSASVVTDYYKSQILSNVPFKSKGNFVYKLDDSVIHLKRAIPENSVVCMDEITLFYHNLDKINCYDLELLLQLQRHFFDGCFYMASIKASRLPQQIREKVSLCKYLLGQSNKSTSFIIGPLLYLIFNKILHIKQINQGLRIWTYQTFEDIDHDNYNFDLSNQTSATDSQNKHFSNLVDIYAFNDKSSFEYNDRFMKYLYDSLDKLEIEQYCSLNFDEDTLLNSGYKKVIDYFQIKKQDHN